MTTRDILLSHNTTLSHLITDLKKAQLHGHLERRWRVYLRPAVLVIDEVGYMQLDRQEAEPLFRLISVWYEHGSIILTSNKYFSDFGETAQRQYSGLRSAGPAAPPRPCGEPRPDLPDAGTVED